MDLQKVVAEQREWVETILKDEGVVERENVESGRRYLRRELVTVITGPRRAGKTYFSIQLTRGKGFGYVNFDDERLLGVENKLDALLDAVRMEYGEIEGIVLDEIQNVRGWELFVSRISREFPVVVTGSNAKLLSSELATHMTGRHVDIEVLPFSPREVLRFYGVQPGESGRARARVKRVLKTYLLEGGFPEVHRTGSAVLRSIYEDVVTKDVVLRHGVRKVSELRSVAKFLVSNYAARVSLNRIRKVFGIKNMSTVRRYVEYLQEAYLFFLLPAYGKAGTWYKKPRKAYVVDTGLPRVVGISDRENWGRRLENAVFLELRRRGLREGENLFYWQDKDGEVDFLIPGKEAIQVCWNIEEAGERELSALIRAMRSGWASRATIITWDEEGTVTRRGKQIRIIPFWRWVLNR